MSKKVLLITFRERKSSQWTDPWLQAIDLEYHNLGSSRGSTTS